MDVYIEYVIIDNMVINSILLFAAAKTLKISARGWRILLSAAIGTVAAAFSPFIALPAAALYALKVALAALMTLLSVGVSNGRRKLIWAFLLFIAYTFLLGGILIGIFLSGKNFSIGGGILMYSESVPLGLFAAGGFAFVWGVYNLVRRLQIQRKASVHAYFARFVLGGAQFSLTAYHDSGNTLMKDGVPVCFVTGGAARQTLKKLVAETMLARSAAISAFEPTVVERENCGHAGRICGFDHDSGRAPACTPMCFVKFSTVVGEGRAAAVYCPAFEIYESTSDNLPVCRLGVYVAVAPSKLKSDYQIILNNSVFE